MDLQELDECEESLKSSAVEVGILLLGPLIALMGLPELFEVLSLALTSASITCMSSSSCRLSFLTSLLMMRRSSGGSLLKMTGDNRLP